jgi:microsomal dipeptidase-like Zn-dependent dipeptidase
MLADLHAHYPMHVVPSARRTHERLTHWEGRWLRSRIVDLISRIANYQGPGDEPSVTVPLLRDGGVGVLLSVLYDPWTELEPGCDHDDPPKDGYFTRLIEQLEAVEAELATHRGEAEVVRGSAELERCLAAGRIAMVHAVEGAVQLGSAAAVPANAAELARRGVAYVTVSHLFWRRVATVAPALPFLPDRLYRLLFRQPAGAGLDDAGRAAVRALTAEGIMVDVTHMSDASLRDTFALLDEIDADRRVPVIATHMACRFGRLGYTMTDDTIRRIAARGGVLGLIACRHYMTDGLRRRGANPTWDDTLALIFAHAERIAEVTGSWDHAAIGSDLDGYIKPALEGLGHEGRMRALEDALIARYGPDRGERIASGNALRVLRARFAP